MKNLLMRADELLNEIEIAEEKLKAMSSQLAEDYFSITRDEHILHSHDKARIINDIILDYIFSISEIIKELRSIVNDKVYNMKDLM